MKFKSILISMLAVAALASCSKEEAGTTTPDTPDTPDMKGKTAYLSVKINAPQVIGTYAPPGTDQGTDSESGIYKIIVIGFDNANTIVEKKTLSLDEQGTVGGVVAPGVGGSVSTAVTGEAFKVSSDLKKILVVANPTGSFETMINNVATTTYADLNAAFTESISNLTSVGGPGTTGFMMTSAGVLAGDMGMTAVLPAIAASSATADVNAAKNQAKTNAAVVNLDRVVAKMKVDISSIAVSNGTKTGNPSWILTGTNSKFYPYAELASGYTGQGKYRVDPNFTGVVNTIDPDLSWEHNTSITLNCAPGTFSITGSGWHGTTSTIYTLENTVGGTYHSGNTTQALIAVRYTPTVIPAITPGESWFRFNGQIKTLTELDADYTTLASVVAAPGSPADKTKKSFEAFLDAVLGDSRTIGWTSESLATTVSIADLDAIPNGGYKATQTGTEDYMIEYFQNSVCFYPVLIEHDNNLTGDAMGHWGIVRNNSYTINVQTISQPGRPYAPDPSDTTIKDPQNGMIPNDKSNAYIAVRIDVNAWATWNQDVNL